MLRPFQDPRVAAALAQREEAMGAFFAAHRVLYQAMGVLKDEWVESQLAVLQAGFLPEPMDIPGPASREMMALCRTAFSPASLVPVTPPGLVTIGGFHGLILEVAEDLVSARAFLDALSSASSVFDHGFPEFLEAAVAEEAMGANRCFPYQPSTTAITAGHSLTSLLPGKWKVAPENDGGSANNAAIKIARAYAHKHGHPNRVKVVALEESYLGNQGLSGMLTSFRVSSSSIYPDGEKRNFVRLKRPRREEIEPFLDVLQTMIDEDSLALVILEAIPGDDGLDPLPAELCQAVLDLCWKGHRIPVCFDEIQSFLRTGKLFAWQHVLGEPPPLITLGKMITGGYYPTSPCLFFAELDALVAPQLLSTFFAHAPGMAVIEAMLKKVDEPRFMRVVAERGGLLQRRLHQLAREHEATKLIVRPKGVGLLAGLEVRDEASDRSLATATALLMARYGVIPGVVGNATVRLHLPPVATENDIALVTELLSKVLGQFATGEVDPLAVERAAGGRSGLDEVRDLAGT